MEYAATKGYYSPPPASAGPHPVVVLVLHGNAGSRVHRLELVQLLRTRLGVGVCVPDYRGYGGSEGAPTEEGLVRAPPHEVILIVFKIFK